MIDPTMMSISSCLAAMLWFWYRYRSYNYNWYILWTSVMLPPRNWWFDLRHKWMANHILSILGSVEFSLPSVPNKKMFFNSYRDCSFSSFNLYQLTNVRTLHPCGSRVNIPSTCVLFNFNFQDYALEYSNLIFNFYF